jgi:hypothetical protein
MSLFGCATATASAQSSSAQITSAGNSLLSVQTVYVEDASAPWFLRWYRNMLDRAPYFSPEIAIAPTSDIVELLSDNPGAIGLVNTARMNQVGNAIGKVKTTSSGFGVCAALVTSEKAGITQLGDLHLMQGKVEVAATRDTLNIAKSIFDRHRATIKVNLIEASSLDINAGLASNKIALAVLPAEDGERLVLPDPGGKLQIVGLSPAAIAAGAKHRFVPGRLITGLLESVLVSRSRLTLCDNIAIVTSPRSTLSHQLLTRSGPPRPLHSAHFGGLVERSMNALEMLWQIILNNEKE